MTVIVGIVDGDHVLIGGDSVGVMGNSIEVRKDKKVFVRKGIAFGYTSSFRMGQLLKYELKIPDQTADPMKYLVTRFIPAVRETFKEHGFAWIENNRESGGMFLVGLKNRLFAIESDFQVGEYVEGYTALGSGYQYALGAISAVQQSVPALDKRNVLKIALNTTGRLCTTVGGPYHIVVSK